jgi:hypothetical protein
MAYVGFDDRIGDVRLAATTLGCGPSCACQSCGGARLGERYIEDDGDEDEPPAEKPVESEAESSERLGWLGETPCPVPASTTRDRCRTQQACPAIPDLVCIRSIAGVPFEYVDSVVPTPQGRLVVGKRSARSVRARPQVGAALERFIAAMAAAGIPVEAILSLGTLYCRCVSNTDQLSDHSFGEAIDVAGVRWRGDVPGRPREILVHNFRLPSDAPWLRRIDACLRLSFPLVLDYHYNADHHNHFHCDLNRGRGRALGTSTQVFTADALSSVLGRPIPRPKSWNDLMGPLVEFAGGPPPQGPRDPWINHTLDTLFKTVAAGRRAAAPGSGGGWINQTLNTFFRTAAAAQPAAPRVHPVR